MDGGEQSLSHGFAVPAPFTQGSLPYRPCGPPPPEGEALRAATQGRPYREEDLDRRIIPPVFFYTSVQS